jgi:hypothetical protein
MQKVITKASGEKELFDPNKIKESLERAGASPSIIKKALLGIEQTGKTKMKSDEVYRCSLDILHKHDPSVAARYSLKRGIMELGPTGYVFEKYVARILEAYGYKTEVSVLAQGKCVAQEIDVSARKGKTHFLIECKYHNARGSKSDLKVVMYTQARFEDVRDGSELRKGRTDTFHQPWLVTNTHVTTEALRYAKCKGIKILAWKYPKKGSLEQIIEKKHLYPISILPSVNKNILKKFTDNNILLAEDLLPFTDAEISQRFGIKRQLADKLYKEAGGICR